MKRDMDLVRELLLKIADAQKPPDFGALVSGHKEGTHNTHLWPTTCTCSSRKSDSFAAWTRSRH